MVYEWGSRGITPPPVSGGEFARHPFALACREVHCWLSLSTKSLRFPHCILQQIPPFRKRHLLTWWPNKLKQRSMSDCPRFLLYFICVACLCCLWRINFIITEEMKLHDSVTCIKWRLFRSKFDNECVLSTNQAIIRLLYQSAADSIYMEVTKTVHVVCSVGRWRMAHTAATQLQYVMCSTKLTAVLW